MLVNVFGADLRKEASALMHEILDISFLQEESQSHLTTEIGLGWGRFGDLAGKLGNSLKQSGAGDKAAEKLNKSGVLDRVVE